MPWRPPSHHTNTDTLTTSDRRYNAERRARRGPDPRSTARWRRVRALVLAAAPLCRDPYGLHPDHLTPATQVDHRIGVWERPDLVYDMVNLTALCTQCHAHKSTMERRYPRHTSDERGKNDHP